MWIRSQDRRDLINTEYVAVESNGVYAINDTQHITLGEYKSEERALEILDTMQKQIVRGTSKDYLSGKNRIFQDYVFSMPGR